MQNQAMIAGHINATIVLMMPEWGQLSDTTDSGVAFSETANHASGVVIENRVRIPINAENGKTRSRRYQRTQPTMFISKQHPNGTNAIVGWPLNARIAAVGISQADPPKRPPNHPPICH
ncbi:hypothetical protein [Rhodopirellula islandica]|uniref:hypothetical protein n=1 Tax=Rhodopirellula islandica TaxID=595434 RepID=UPI001364CB82|nr:hypothetical protein [Rhodopirellula islandica]